jgi:hypothetical protein
VTSWCNHYYVGRAITPQKAKNVYRYLKAYAERLNETLAEQEL